jgi:hypothetical protein
MSSIDSQSTERSVFSMSRRFGKIDAQNGRMVSNVAHTVSAVATSVHESLRKICNSHVIKSDGANRSSLNLEVRSFSPNCAGVCSSEVSVYGFNVNTLPFE